jgi:hypothetical protein
MHLASCLLACSLLTAHLAVCATEIVRTPRPEFDGDRRYDYPLQLLQLALSKSSTKYEIRQADVAMNQERQVLEIEAGRTIDVGPIPSSAEREARLQAIYIPLNKGLLGWRLGLVRKGDSGKMSGVDNLAGLKTLRIAQGQEWPDTQILRANGIEVITAPKYEGLFKMLIGGRFDYFPRSMMEIWDEQALNADTLEVEPHLTLHYLYDAYFMVNRRNTKLANDIREGLEKSIADGSFDKVFQDYFGERLRKARLGSRAVIELRNPLLTPGTPSDRPELWYDAKRGR